MPGTFGVARIFLRRPARGNRRIERTTSVCEHNPPLRAHVGGTRSPRAGSSVEAISPSARDYSEQRSPVADVDGHVTRADRIRGRSALSPPELAGEPIGQELPSGRLGCYLGCPVNLSELGDRLVLYFYPGCLCSPEDGYRAPAVDAAQHRAFASRRVDFDGFGCVVVGVSSHSLDVQRRVAADTGLTHALLSDPDMCISQALGLPTFNVDNRDWYCRLTLLAIGGRIRHVLSPASGPASAAQAIAWLRAQGF